MRELNKKIKAAYGQTLRKCTLSAFLVKQRAGVLAKQLRLIRYILGNI